MAFNCTLCGLGPRASIVLVGILSMLFAGGYVFFTTAGIMAHNCQINMTRSPEEYAIYLFYLRSSDCGRVNLTHLGIRNGSDIFVDVPDVTDAAQRTYIFCIVGVILFGVWFITSFFSLLTSCATCMGRCCIAVGIYPYIIALVLVLIYSVVAFVFYFIDFVQSFELDFVLDLLEIQNQNLVRPIFERIDDIYLIVPPLIMWLTASIGVLFWFMFFVFVFVMLSVASRLWAESKPAPSYDSATRSVPQTQPQTATAPLEILEEHKVIVHTGPSVAAARYNDPARQPNEPIPYNQLPPSSVNVRRTIEPLKPGHEPSHQINHNNNEVHYPSEIPPPLRPSTLVNPYTDKRFSYSPGHPQPFSYLAGPPQQQVSPRSSVNVPEVRSQLPWSYLQGAGDEPAMPRRLTATLTEHKEFPGETIRAPMSKPSAPSDDRSSDEGKWSGPEYRY